MSEIANLFKDDLIFFENVATWEELFEQVGSKLLDKNLVKPSFVEAIKERERNYPTGLDLSVVGEDTPNVAIPHTETEHCNSDQIVVVKLNNEIMFNNMIAPDKELNVRFVFFILNSQKSVQTNILSNLMGFFTKDNNVNHLNQLETAEEVYQYIQEKI
ncbi:PTS sugar transporter subunit IIA [Caldibacillus thermoamylovorans]|uniref:PTS sugar transporter subunit IIA n=1 Tax=Caldibacillus thermoamylovorans TaxID=35841 RepID=UPI001D07BD88|nr:PTS sugar transporter subunit IIA [Caldibacillus thermoamylovorans]MCB5936676.1 PTS sugar transporter subunit IIA [Bacillus sp. DFI.2.34]MCB7078206.1 PTS sugar transporter subunit IIA [Caldibacillus thermoamylovorans]